MPSLKKMFYNTVGTVTMQPDWYVPLKVNRSGYRSQAQASADLHLTAQLMGQNPDFMYLPRAIENAHYGLTIYGRAGHPKNKFLILGRVDRGRLSTPERPVIDRSFPHNFGPVDELDGKTGSVLNASKNAWSFYVNDMFITGGIANKRTFYLASPRTEANFTEQGRLTIFGREMAGLLMAGYEPQTLMNGSEAMIPGGGLRSLSIADYNRNLRLFNTPEIITAMAHPNLVRIDFLPETRTLRPIIADF